MLTLRGRLAYMRDPLEDLDTVPLNEPAGAGIMHKVTTKEISDRELTPSELDDALDAMRRGMLTPITTVEVAQLLRRTSSGSGGGGGSEPSRQPAGLATHAPPRPPSATARPMAFESLAAALGSFRRPTPS